MKDQFIIVRRDAGVVASVAPADGLTRLAMTDRERQRRDRQRAMSIAEFGEQYGLGRTKTYAELKSGRLRGRKIGKRTVIAVDDAEDWLQCLPIMRGAPKKPSS